MERPIFATSGTTRDAPAEPLAAWARWRPVDVAALAFTASFLGWVAFGWGGAALAPAIDFTFFLPLGVAVGLLQLRVARELDDRRERLAWRLLAGASFARFVSGNLWGVLLLTNRGFPSWLAVLASVYLVVGTAALLAFPSAPLRRVDWVRFGLDGLIVLTGSLLIVWFAAIVPWLRPSAETATRDYFYTIGDSLGVVLSAVLYLRSSKPLTRAVALLLLLAYVLQIVPDVLLTAPKLAGFRPGDTIEIAWYAVWALKWAAARYSLTQLATRREVVTATPADYSSGVLPYVFVGAMTVVLLFHLASRSTTDTALLLFGSGAVAALLVVRQYVELRERDRLHQRLLDEASWFRAVLQHAYAFLALVDDGGRVVFLSPATERLLGADHGGVPDDALWAALHPDDAARLRGIVAVRGFAPTVVTCRLRVADGSWRELSLRLQDLRDEPLVGAVMINGHDATREGQIMRRLRDAEEMEALGLFAGGLAHDLNNFLAVVGSLAELLRAEIPAARERAIADLIAIQAATKRATALTSGLMTLSRRKPESRVVVEFGDFVRDRLRHIAADVEYRAPAGRLAVRVYPASLRHAVDAVLNDQLAQQLPGRRPAVSVSTVTVSDPEATRLELTPGRYVVLDVGVPSDAAGETRSALALPNAGADWEHAPDDLGMLLVHATMREAGGALAVSWDGAHPRAALYLPGASA